eukprot:TRINITY_DN11622_c0_g1_i2.p1 TRINITY_DN11622_c0_g1~~TRINITY_DN11622_c0_g1_i2.p1  ORF type:complete len:326 (+),score=47.86 TRINITY_DN11622_c0_g1_i2:145-1122(+)
MARNKHTTKVKWANSGKNRDKADIKKLDQKSPFNNIPLITLNTKILSKFSSRSLCCLACVDKFFNKYADSDDVWHGVCQRKGWEHVVDSQDGWKTGFLKYRKHVCVECECRTDYVFALLKCRVCEKCEHQNPRYALATLAEARDGYGLSDAELKTLPCLERYQTYLFLRSQVAELATKLGKHLSTDAKARNMQVKTPLEKERLEAQAILENWDEGDEGDEDEEEEEEIQEHEDDLTFSIDDIGDRQVSCSSCSSTDDPRQIAAIEKLKAKKEADNLARKAHKKQVKQQNREKRAAKKSNSSKLGSSPKMGASPPDDFPGVVWSQG